jgi:hypothetical protein
MHMYLGGCLGTYTGTYVPMYLCTSLGDWGDWGNWGAWVVWVTLRWGCRAMLGRVQDPPDPQNPIITPSVRGSDRHRNGACRLQAQLR